jgi:hypothetical protein
VPVWNTAAAQVAAQQARSLSENARAFALLNAALSDALASTMDAKYFYRFWRPETAIRAGDSDSNPRTAGNPGFVPLVTTPCFPSYPSAHAVTAGAAREVLERLYGRKHHAITLTTASLPGMVLQYSSFKEITEDIDDARVYGGIHFRFDQEVGQDTGRRIGDFVYRNKLQRPPENCGDQQNNQQ